MENLKIVAKAEAPRGPVTVITIATHTTCSPGKRGAPVGAATFTHRLDEGSPKMIRSAISGFINRHAERETLLTSLRALQAYLRMTPEGSRYGVIVCVNSLAFMDSLEATRAHFDAEKMGQAPAQLRNRTLWKSLLDLMG